VSSSSGKVRIEHPLFRTLTFEEPSPDKAPGMDARVDLGTYLVLRYFAYANVVTIFILSTLTYNLVQTGAAFLTPE
jgi:hypothetical protein